MRFMMKRNGDSEMIDMIFNFITIIIWGIKARVDAALIRIGLIK